MIMKGLVFIALFHVFVGAHSCNFTPDLWCSSPEIARECGVEKQCAKWQLKQGAADAPLVQYDLYYESLCPGCRELITTQLFPAWQKVGSIVNVSLVPYGNAQERKVGDKWEFTCQHGADECKGNLIETCTLALVNFSVAFPMINCLETYGPATYGSYCASQYQVDYKQIENCTQSMMGNELEHKMALRTNALKPPHQYTPWVVLNGQHNDQIQSEAQTDSLGLICKTYTGTKPPACHQISNQVPMKTCPKV